MRGDQLRVSIRSTTHVPESPVSSPQFTTPRSPSPEIPSSESSPFVDRTPVSPDLEPQQFFNALLPLPSSPASVVEHSLSRNLSQLNLNSNTPNTEVNMGVSGSDLTFSGKPGDCKPSTYTSFIERRVRRDNPDLERDDDPEGIELRDEFRKAAFQQGLAGPALYWFEEERLACKTYAEFKPLFEEQYKNLTERHDSSLITEAHQLGRKTNETLQDFLQRVQSLYHRIPVVYRSVVLTNAILRMTDGRKDTRLQERIQDRLYATDQWIDGFTTEKLTFDKLHRLIWDCRSSADGELKPPGTEELSPTMQSAEFTQHDKTEDLLARLAEVQLKLAENLTERNSSNGRTGGTRWPQNPPQNNPNSQMNNNDLQVRNKTYQGNTSGPGDSGDKRYWWCFNCAEWGHKSSSCPIPQNAERRTHNSNLFYDNRVQMMADRARTLRAEPTAAIKSVLSFKTPRPPTGFMLTPTVQHDHEASQVMQQGERTPMRPFQWDANYAEPWRPERKLSEPWRPENNGLQPERSLAEPWRPLEAKAATRSTSQSQAQNPPDVRIKKNTRGNKEKVVNNEKLMTLAEAVISHPEWIQRSPSQNKPQPIPGPRVVELGDYVETPMMNDDKMDTDPPEEISEAEFTRLWDKLKPHVEKHMAKNQQNESGKTDSDTAKKPRYLLDKIRATEQYEIPNFEIGRHLKDTPITMSVLELLQIAPSIRQQLSRLMQCRRKLKGTRHEEKLVNVLAPFKQILETEMNEDPKELPVSTEVPTCNLVRDADSGRLAVYSDSGLPEEAVATTLGYITGHLGGHRTDVILLDGGSGVNLVNSRFLEDNGIRPLNLSEKEPIRLANDEVVYITQFAILELRVGNVLTVITVYLIDGNSDWDLLVGRPWLRRVQAVEYYADEKLVVKGINDKRSVLDITPCPRRYQPTQGIETGRPVYRQDWSEELEEKNVVRVEDDEQILCEVEGILAELHGAIRGTQERDDNQGN
ncbi:hypothetical protein FPOAC2_07426 [Fusarium poae]|uniref:hypothetical protein n=1 Tax=Fusarium poae TaxID=36050 RepID=UPI001CEAA63E|nr:hypothetical protein FPOAC1_007319 [Fusarium poae]KAG8674000.1 hypothetical protein FPOAC1_007319 [Fusarium poae]